MSDSDDTDVLLLIPPNFFMTNAEKQFQHEQQEQNQWQTFQQQSQFAFNDCVQYINERLDDMLHQQQKYGSVAEKSKAANELSQHNLGLHNSYMAAHDSDASSTNHLFIVPPASEVSTICGTSKSKAHHRNDNVLCSTPKSTSGLTPASSSLTLGTLLSSPTSSLTAIPMFSARRKCTPVHELLPEDAVLQEIDDFLVGRGSKTSKLHNCSRKCRGNLNDCMQLWSWPENEQAPQEQLARQQTPTQDAVPNNAAPLVEPTTENEYSLKPQDLDQRDIQQQRPRGTNNTLATPAPCQENLQMMSLSDFWGAGARRESSSNYHPNTSTPAIGSATMLKEEQMRRQHLQKTVQGLQARLLEYQQRLSIAIEVDRSKTEALSGAHTEINK